MVVEQSAATQRVIKLALPVFVRETLHYFNACIGLRATSVCEPARRKSRLKFLSLTASRAIDHPIPAQVHLSADKTVAKAILKRMLSDKIDEDEESTCRETLDEALDIILESCTEPLAKHDLHLNVCQPFVNREEQMQPESLIASYSCSACPIDTTAGDVLLLFATGAEPLKSVSPAVLVVDDSTIGRKIIRKTLAGIGCNVVGEAANGIEAIQAYRSFRPDLVTMDITMPKMDGLRAARQILTDWPDANIIMLTSMQSETTVAAAFQHGVRHYILKPFCEETLRRKIAGILGPPAECLGACLKP